MSVISPENPSSSSGALSPDETPPDGEEGRAGEPKAREPVDPRPTAERKPGAVFPHHGHLVPLDCWKQCGPRLAWWVFACGLVWLLGLPFWIDLPLFACLSIAMVIGQRAQLIALGVSCLLGLGGLEVTVRALAKPGHTGQFFRPHEMMERHVSPQPALDPPLPRYEPNASLDFDMRAGDLLAVDPGAPQAIFEPRRVHFQTDRYGLRNNADYNGERLLLVGDSFVNGTGSDQSLCLANVLAREHGIAAYSLAHVASPDHYMARLDWGFKRLSVPQGTRGLAFIFEGNDFVPPPGMASRPPALPNWFDARKLETIGIVRGGFKTTETLFNATRQLQRLLWPSADHPVETYRIGDQYVGFFGYYVDAARAPTLEVNLAATTPPELLKRLLAVFFVPTKYRVYSEWLHDGRPPMGEPAPGLEALERVFDPLGVPVIDLAPRLRKGAREQLEHGAYVYYRGDTHWNAAGVKIGADVVVETLQRYGDLSHFKRPSGGAP